MKLTLKNVFLVIVAMIMIYLYKESDKAEKVKAEEQKKVQQEKETQSKILAEKIEAEKKEKAEKERIEKIEKELAEKEEQERLAEAGRKEIIKIREGFCNGTYNAKLTIFYTVMTRLFANDRTPYKRSFPSPLKEDQNIKDDPNLRIVFHGNCLYTVYSYAIYETNYNMPINKPYYATIRYVGNIQEFYPGIPITKDEDFVIEQFSK
jgi:hypothetical protein